MMGRFSAVLDHAYGRIIFNTGPPEGVPPFPKREILGNLAIAKHETIRKTSANPVSRVLQADPNMEINNDFVPISQKFLGLAGSLGPCPASFANVLLDFGDTMIGTGCRKALGLDAHNLRIKILGYALH